MRAERLAAVLDEALSVLRFPVVVLGGAARCVAGVQRFLPDIDVFYEVRGLAPGERRRARVLLSSLLPVPVSLNPSPPLLGWRLSNCRMRVLRSGSLRKAPLHVDYTVAGVAYWPGRGVEDPLGGLEDYRRIIGGAAYALRRGLRHYSSTTL